MHLYEFSQVHIGLREYTAIINAEICRRQHRLCMWNELR